jgi:3-oxoacyl-[acyl-carrier-protein] synthase II
MHALDDRIAVSGIGVLSPIGIGAPHFWSALCEGISGIRPLPGASRAPRVGAQLVDYLPRNLITTPHLRRMDPLSRMLVSATRLAVGDAGLEPSALSADSTGIVAGSAFGNLQESTQYLEKLFEKGPSLASPMQFPNLVLNAPASYAAMELASHGINLTVADGEVSGDQAVLVGASCLRQGHSRRVLAGGADEWAEILVHAFHRARLLAGQHGGEEQCRPFDARRSGTVLGEGAGMLVLEKVCDARARDVMPYAVIEDGFAFGIPCPTYGWPRDSKTTAEALGSWLESIQVKASAIDLVMANGNGLRQFDRYLLDTLGTVLGCGADAVLTSIRGAVGDFGAAGALSLATACLALRHQTVPPLCHTEHPDPAAPFALAAQRGVARRIERVLHFSVARGGSAVALLLQRWPS